MKKKKKDSLPKIFPESQIVREYKRNSDNDYSIDFNFVDARKQRHETDIN